MAKIKFPLEMANGEQVRTLGDLKDNFDIEKVVGYFLDGKLKTWLEDRYYEDESEAIDLLDKYDADLAKKLCNIFGVYFEETKTVDAEVIAERNARLEKLKQFTDDEEIIKNVDLVAFNQEELGDLYDKGADKIYLCEGEFNIPKSKQDLEYVEIGGAVVKGKIIKENKTENNEELTIEEILSKAEKFCIGENGVKNYAKYFEWLSLAENKGSIEATYLIGRCYMYGIGVEEDYKTGFEYIKRSAINGYDEANIDLGDFYFEGEIVEKDIAKAKQYYEKAKNSGFDRAKEKFEKCYFMIELEKAMLGDVSAIAEVGSCYWNGFGVTKNYGKAVEYFQKAASFNHAGAIRNLGVAYHYGCGVSKSILQAKYHYEKALMCGDDTAKHLLDALKLQNNW